MQIKENIKAPRHWPLCGEFPAQMASYAENVSIWWRHHGIHLIGGFPSQRASKGSMSWRHPVTLTSSCDVFLFPLPHEASFIVLNDIIPSCPSQLVWLLHSGFEDTFIIFEILAWLTGFHLGKNPFGHDDVMKWKHFPRYRPFVRGIHPWPVNSPHKGQWRRALMFSLIYAWTNGWANNRDTGDLRRHRAHYVVTVMERNCLLTISVRSDTLCWE